MITKADAARELLRRREARRSLLSFIRYINPEYIVSDFSRQVCAALEQFVIDCMNGERPVLILGAPPQHGKSDIVSRYLPAWVFGHYPDLRIAGLSYAKDLASDMNRDVQKIMASDEYALLFPDSSFVHGHAGAANSDRFDVPGGKGAYVGQGVGGPLTGKRVDLGIIDDPIKNSKEALSSTVKESVWKWYGSTFLTRLSKNSGHIIMATRWATDDLSGRVIESNKRAKVLSFPAINAKGEALIPDLHPVEKLLETKTMLGDYFWSAMYQQSPVALGGNMFKAEWWQFYKVAPQIKWRGIYADTAQKTKDANDYSVLQLWGESIAGQAVLLDQIRGKWEAPDLLIQARAFWNKHRASGVRSFNIEDKVSGTGLIQTLKREGVPVVAIQRNTDKITRAMDAAPFVQAGNVLLPEDAPWLSDYLSEFAAFPNGTNDDQCDPTMDAIKDMLQGGAYSLSAWA